jgi:hypothetical protein
MTIASDIFLVARGPQDNELMENFEFLNVNKNIQEMIDNKTPITKRITINKPDTLSNKQDSITLFKQKYKRHTNFCKNIQNTYPENVPLYGGKAIFKLKPAQINGHLLNGMALELKTPQITFSGGSSNVKNSGKLVDKVGLAMLKEVNIYFGETLIDSLNGEYINLENEINLDEDSFNGYNNLIGHTLVSQKFKQLHEPRLLVIPLPFWFCKNISDALPLSAMNAYNENNNCIRVEIIFKNFDKLVHYSNTESGLTYNVSTNEVEGCKLLLETMTLNDHEKERFASITHKYLITQVKKKVILTGANDTIFSIDLNFGSNIKELIWVARRLDSMKPIPEISTNYITRYNNHFDYISAYRSGTNMFKNFSFYKKNTLMLNILEPQFFNMYLPYKNYRRTPSEGIFVYNFAEKPNMKQPSGNYNDIQEITIKGNMNDTYGRMYVIVYAVCYNVLTINNGSAKLDQGYEFHNQFDDFL